MELKIIPAKSINGAIQVPGDKSISHRALIFGSLCDGDVEVSNFLNADDCLSTLNILRQLGVKIEQSGNNLLIKGVGKYGFKAPAAPLDVGNSGTTLRILPGLLAAQPFESTLLGDKSVSSRPMDRIINPLSEMGADIQGTNGHAPLHILPPHPSLSPTGRGDKLLAISYRLPVASAQVKSAILLAGLFAEGQTVVSEDFKSRDHTERMLTHLRHPERSEGSLASDSSSQAPQNDSFSKTNSYKYSVTGDTNLKAKPIQIPGDISSAAFFIIAALLLRSELTIKNVGINPTRIGILTVLEQSGAHIEQTNKKMANEEPIADLLIKSSTLKPFMINAPQIPLLVDEIPILAVAATQIDGTSVINGAQELRIKETDRLKAISTELIKMGADVEEKPDGLIITGPTKLKGTVVDSGGDHRMAMSLAIAGLLAEGQTVIKDAQSIDISFPGFKEVLDSIKVD